MQFIVYIRLKRQTSQVSQNVTSHVKSTLVSFMIIELFVELLLPTNASLVKDLKFQWFFFPASCYILSD